MRQSLKALRQKRTLLDRAIHALEELEALKASRAQLRGDMKPAGEEVLPGGFMVLPGGAAPSRVSRWRSKKSEPGPRTGSRRANKG